MFSPLDMHGVRHRQIDRAILISRLDGTDAAPIPAVSFHDQEGGWHDGSFAARAKSPKLEGAWSLVNLIWGVLTEAQVLSCELIDGCASHKLHIARDFAPHQIQRAFDTRLPRGREWE